MAARTKAELLSENQHLQERERIHVKMISDLLAERERLTAEPYIALKALDHHGCHPTTLLRAAQRGLIDAKQEGSLWFARQSSVTSYVLRRRGRQA